MHVDSFRLLQVITELREISKKSARLADELGDWLDEPTEEAPKGGPNGPRSDAKPNPYAFITGPIERDVIRLLCEHPKWIHQKIAEEVCRLHPGARTSNAAVAWYLHRARLNPRKRALLPPERL